MANNVVYDRYILKNGIPSDFWVLEAARIKEFVQQMKIQPVDQSYLADDPVPVPNVAATARVANPAVLYPRPFPGGLKTAHLHFQGNVYLLTDEQWKKFSADALKTLKDKLNKASTVGFGPMMELSDAISGLA